MVLSISFMYYFKVPITHIGLFEKVLNDLSVVATVDMYMTAGECIHFFSFHIWLHIAIQACKPDS